MLSNSQFQTPPSQPSQPSQPPNFVLVSSSTLNSVTSASASDISTIFIIGFPDDFKERELINMFLFASGFEGAVLKTTNISLNFSTSTSTSNNSLDETNRKQLIGFVKFSKASEAIYALEVLNGKILDQERGLVLKAEIAKKNLYIKSTASLAVSIGFPSKTSSNISTPAATAAAAASSTMKSINNFNFPSSLSDDESILISAMCTCSSPISDSSPCQSCPIIANRSALTSPPPPQLQHRMMSITLPGESGPSIICAPEVIGQEEPAVPVKIIEVPATMKPSSSLIYSTSTTPSPPILLSKGVPPLVSDRVLDIATLQKTLIASPNLGSMAAIVGENFPCNTLYVGNLPPSAQEEELRALFRNCLGYRRLSFRPKSSGPMCFVEFEDIACATAAMETLYGTMISCSTPVKGGIRLSFSKNPLGLRVASPSPSSPTSAASITTSSNSFMEAIGAETDNPDHRQAISIIFSHYYKINPHRSLDTIRF